MTWITDTLLLPLLEALYLPCDWILGWTSLLGPVWGVVAVGAVSGVAVMVFQKYASRQKELAQCKADLRILKDRSRKAKESGDRETAGRLGGLIGRISAKYMWGALKPALWTVPLIGVVALWCGSRLGFLPIRPGDAVEVVAHFEDGAGGFAHVVPGDGLRPAGPAIAAPQAGEARWAVLAEKEGDHRLRVRHADRTYEVLVPVAARGGRPPEPVTVFNRETPRRDQLQAVELKLAPGMPEAWWNLTIQWAGLYLGVALLVALPLRFALGIQ
jgi:uncharacterized membrane protein (DUF106 family)